LTERVLERSFFPTIQHPDHEGTVTHKKDSGPVVFNLKTGFFSSARPAHGHLLLTVNTAMSAFFPTISLQDWIDIRVSGRIGEFLPPDEDATKELKGVRVVFEGEIPKEGKARKARVISGFSEDYMEDVRFTRPKGANFKTDEIVSVWEHMTTSKVVSETPKLCLMVDHLSLSDTTRQ
jgi:hypothetical protein